MNTRNTSQWRHIAEFLDAQYLASFGLRRVSDAEREARRGPACGEGPRGKAVTVHCSDATMGTTLHLSIPEARGLAAELLAAADAVVHCART